MTSAVAQLQRMQMWSSGEGDIKHPTECLLVLLQRKALVATLVEDLLGDLALTVSADRQDAASDRPDISEQEQLALPFINP